MKLKSTFKNVFFYIQEHLVRLDYLDQVDPLDFLDPKELLVFREDRVDLDHLDLLDSPDQEGTLVCFFIYTQLLNEVNIYI